MSFGKPHKAVFSSSVVALIAFLLAIPAYQQLLHDQNPTEALTDLRFGKHGYLLNDQQGRCIGWLRYELEYDGAYSFLFDGNFRYALEEAESELSFRAGVGFNTLNQLSGTYVRIQHEQNEYLLRSEGVTPIQLFFEGPVRGKDVKFQHKIKGPIEIYEPRQGEFLIRSEQFPSFEQLTRQVKSATPLSPVLPFLPIQQEFDGGEELEAACRSSGAAYFSLDDFKKLLMRVGSLVFS